MLRELRKEYKFGELAEKTVDPDPIVQFRHWFEFAIQAELIEVNAMTLATVTKDGNPSARIVLLKEFDEKGFVFFTNYEGRKGLELKNNLKAALVFYWKELERQVRIEGDVERESEKESDKYFSSRPMESKISAIISNQSQVVKNRDELEERWVSFLKENYSEDIQRPENWGGYRVIPKSIEFWQGRPNRLNDRILYTKMDNNWKIERLEP